MQAMTSLRSEVKFLLMCLVELPHVTAQAANLTCKLLKAGTQRPLDETFDSACAATSAVTGALGHADLGCAA